MALGDRRARATLLRVEEAVLAQAGLPGSISETLDLYRDGKRYCTVQLIGRMYGGEYVGRITRTSPEMPQDARQAAGFGMLFSIQLMMGSRRWQVRRIALGKGVGFSRPGSTLTDGRPKIDIDTELSAIDGEEVAADGWVDTGAKHYGLDKCGRFIMHKRKKFKRR